MTPVPEAGNEDATKTAAIFYYSDGKTEIGRMGKNRELVTLNKIPKHVQEAVIAAENKGFRTDPGFSASGISRAVWNNVKGGETQGGSTITQQLAKNYYLTDERSMSRKFKELFISVKLGKEKGKDQILQDYLNTIYFGRQAYGIQAASKTYFGVSVDKLRPDQGALLAAIIQRPGQLDPRSSEYKQETLGRYQYVLKNMTETNALNQTDYEKYKAKLPGTKRINANQVFAGQNGYMIKRAMKELERDQKIDEKEIVDQGLHIVTTFDKQKMKAAQRAAEDTIDDLDPKDIPKHVRVGIASVETGTGRVVAFYGGPDFLKHEFDNVWSGSAQAGSAMKPYVLATALKEGYSLKSLVEGRSMSCFNTEGNVVPPGTSCRPRIPNGHAGGSAVDLMQATRSSINTAYVQLGLKVGLSDVIKTATDAGVAPDQMERYKGAGGLSLGINDIRPIEQAAGYAAFANGGNYYQPHVVDKVLEKDHKKIHKRLIWKKKKDIFSAGVAADATFAMRSVVTGGTGTAARLADGRPVAGKTGTTDKNVATWFVGYIPQMSTAVTVYNEKKKTLVLDGAPVQGGSVPARLWNAYMSDATKGMDIKQFPDPANVGSPMKWATPKPSPTASEAPTCKPGQVSRPRIGKPCKPDPSGQPGGKPCMGPGGQFPPGCNPDIPPFGPGRQQPKWWCDTHPGAGPPECRRGRPGPGGPSGPDPDDQEPRSGGIFSRPPD